MEHKLTIAEASRLMGATPQFIRLGLQKGVLPFGFAVQMSPNRYTYYISREKFAEYLGIKI